MSTALIQRIRTQAKKRRREKPTKGRLAQNIKMYRTRVGLTQPDVAGICECTAQYISDIECDRVPSLRMLALVAIALDTTVSELLAGVPSEELLTAD